MDFSKIHSSWDDLFEQHYSIELPTDNFYPKPENVFNVFQMPVDDIKIVLLGQDPYINKNQATGFSFSVPKNQKIPPSLINIFKEIKNEFPEKNYNFVHGDLTKWTNQGIFLLNTALTTEPGKSNSHSSIWKQFTDETIKYIDEHNINCTFLLFGNNAKQKNQFIINNKSLQCAHPSPLSANRGFFNSGIFKKIKYEIDWQN